MKGSDMGLTGNSQTPGQLYESKKPDLLLEGPDILSAKQHAPQPFNRRRNKCGVRRVSWLGFTARPVPSRFRLENSGVRQGTPPHSGGTARDLNPSPYYPIKSNGT